MESLVNRQNLQKFYSGRKVFVTGHTGFKGSWLVTWLQLMGATIKGYALPPENENEIFRVVSPHLAIENIFADIRDRNRLQQELAAFQPDYVFHLAAQPLVRRSYQVPAETFEVNVTGTANLLEALMSLQKNCTAVIVTTDKVYENKEQIKPYKEKNRLGGFDPYSASKACAEIVAESFRRSFFNGSAENIKMATARAGNVIGGGDWNTDRLMPDIINHLRSGKTIPVRNPEAIRPWQHVLEPLKGYLILAANLSNGNQLSSSYNFGPKKKDHLSVKELVEIAIECWGSGDWNDSSDPSQPHEAGVLKLNINLAKKELGWKPKLNSRQAIKWTIDWYKQPAQTLFDYTLAQIKSYQQL